MMTKIRARFAREEGQTMAEYAVVLAVITVATVAAVQAFRKAQGLDTGEYGGPAALVDADLVTRLRAHAAERERTRPPAPKTP